MVLGVAQVRWHELVEVEHVLAAPVDAFLSALLTLGCVDGELHLERRDDGPEELLAVHQRVFGTGDEHKHVDLLKVGELGRIELADGDGVDLARALLAGEERTQMLEERQIGVDAERAYEQAHHRGVARLEHGGVALHQQPIG